MKSLKSKLLVGALVSSLAAGVLYADYGGSKNFEGNGCGYQKGFMKKGKNNKFLKGVMSELDLSISQRKELRDFMEQKFEKQKNIASFFKNGKFDKTGFMKSIENKRDVKIKNKADMLEKVYSILDAKQKKEFVYLLEEKFENRGMRF